MDWSGIKNRWQAAFGQKKPVEPGMPPELRQELESTISLFTKMNRLDQLLEVIREHRETYNEPWLLQAELSIVRQLNVAEFETLEEPYEDLSEAAEVEWPDIDSEQPEPTPSVPEQLPPEPVLAEPPPHAQLEIVEPIEAVAEPEVLPVHISPVARPAALPKGFSLDCDDEDDDVEGTLFSDESDTDEEAVEPALNELEFDELPSDTADSALEQRPDEAEEDELDDREKDSEPALVDIDTDEVVEQIESFEEDDDPVVWRDELDPDLLDMVVETSQPPEQLTRVERSTRARQVAAELIAKHDWPHHALPILVEIFNRKSYGAARVALDRLMSDGLTLDALILASQIRTIWHQTPAFWISFNKAGDEAYDTQYLLSWPAAINLLNAFTNMPTIDEVEIFLDDQLDYWMNNRSLRRSFRSFRLYLWFRTAGLQGTLPPDEHRNFDQLLYEDGVDLK